MKYKLFLSYSHVDKPTARWLFRALDGYRPPREAAAPRLAPWRVFRDEDELPAGRLSEKIEAAIRESENLVVLCSPDAVTSPYVNEEIRLFRRMRGNDRVFALIVRGKPGHPVDECFPTALKTRFDPEGNATDTDEPLASDLTVSTRKQALHKLVAGVLGMPYGDLANREKRRRTHRIAWFGAAGVTTAFVLTIAGMVAVMETREGLRNRSEVHTQSGLSALKDDNLPAARTQFQDALGLADSVVARAGLVSTLQEPASRQNEWQAPQEQLGDRLLSAVDFAGESTIVVTAQSGAVHALDLERNRPVWTVRLPSRLNALAVDMERGRVVVGSEDGRLSWLSLRDGSAIDTHELGHPILSVRLHGATGRLAVGTRGGVVALDRDKKHVFELLHSHAGLVQGMAFNQPGSMLYWGGSGSYIWACPLEGDRSGACDRLDRVEEWVYAIDGTQDTRYTAYAAGGNLRVVDHAVQVRNTVAEEPGHLFAVRFDPSSRLLVAAGSEKTLSVFDVRSQRRLMTVPAHGADVYGIAFSPSGNRFATVGHDGLARVWGARFASVALPPHRQLPVGVPLLTAPQRNRISEIRVIGDRLALVGTWDQRTRVLVFKPGEPGADAPPSHDEAMYKRLVESLDLARTRSFRFSELSPAGLWAQPEPPPESMKAILDAEPRPASHLSRDGSTLVSADAAGTVHVFAKGAAMERKELGLAGVTAMATAGGGRVVVAGLRDGSVMAYRRADWSLLFTAKCGKSEIAAIIELASRKRLAVASSRGPLCLVGLDGKVLAAVGDTVRDAVALSPDESMIATAGVTNEIVLLATDRLQEIGRVDHHRGSVNALHFTLDSSMLLSGGADETLRQFPAMEALALVTAPIDELRAKYPMSPEAVAAMDLRWWRRLLARLAESVSDAGLPALPDRAADAELRRVRAQLD